MYSCHALLGTVWPFGLSGHVFPDKALLLFACRHASLSLSLSLSLFLSLPTLMTPQVTGMVGADSATEEASALPVVPQPAPAAAPSTTSKLKRFAGFVAHTRIGQSVMKSNVVKKLSEKVSNMPLVLSVELKALYGTMTVNFPPPPSGVVW